MLLTIIKIFGKRIISVKSIHLITQWICQIPKQYLHPRFNLDLKTITSSSVSSFDAVNILSRYLNTRKVQISSATLCFVFTLQDLWQEKRNLSLPGNSYIFGNFKRGTGNTLEGCLEIFEKSDRTFSEEWWKYFRWVFENISL